MELQKQIEKKTHGIKIKGEIETQRKEKRKEKQSEIE